MTQRVFLLAAAVIFLIQTPSMAQEKQESPASPSDIPVEKIKQEAAKAKPEQAKPAGSQDNTPKPVAKGTPVAQPDCGDSNGDCGCDPCKKRCRGGLMRRIRTMFSWRCCE